MADRWTHPRGLFPGTLDYERESIAGGVIRKACEYDSATGRMYLTCSVGEVAQRIVIALDPSLAPPEPIQPEHPWPRD